MLKSMEPGEVFVSYSGKDRDLVDGFVKLLRLENREVFLDHDSIELGQQWEPELASAVRRASTMVVFWCCHAASSEWVRRELDLAVELGKRIVPVPLCTAEPWRAISAHQGINNLAERIRHGCLRKLPHRGAHSTRPINSLAVAMVLGVLLCLLLKVLIWREDQGPGAGGGTAMMLIAVLSIIARAFGGSDWSLIAAMILLPSFVLAILTVAVALPRALIARRRTRKVAQHVRRLVKQVEEANPVSALTPA